MTLEEEIDAVRPRGALRLLVDRDFGLFFWGRLLTVTSVYLHSVVAAIIVYTATHSAMAVAMVTVAQFAPQLVFALAAGAHADKGDVGHQIVLGRLLCSLGSGALMVWLLLAGNSDGWLMAWMVVLASFVTGLGLVIGGPAMQSITPLLVTRQELPAAVTLNSVPMTVGRVAGPAVGALLFQEAGAVVALAVAVAGHLIFMTMMLFVIHVPAPDRPSIARPQAMTIAAMLRHVRQDRPLLLLLVAAAGIGFGAEPITTLAPVIAFDLGGGPGMVGAITSAFGLGAGVGIVASSWMSSRVRHELVVQAGVLALAVGVLVCGLATTVWLVMAAGAVAGTGFIVAISSATTVIQLRVPPYLLGRVMALWLMGFVGSRPVAAVVTGLVTDLVSTRAACIVVAVVLAAVAAWCRPSRLA